jgi:hypothetical protein
MLIIWRSHGHRCNLHKGPNLNDARRLELRAEILKRSELL